MPSSLRIAPISVHVIIWVIVQKVLGLPKFTNPQKDPVQYGRVA